MNDLKSAFDKAGIAVSGYPPDKQIRRGAILNAVMSSRYQGSMQGGVRPVIVVSNNMANKHSKVVTVVPLSTKVNKKKKLPTHVLVPVTENNGLDHDSVALCEQVTALDVSMIEGYLGQLNDEVLERITIAVQVQVGVFDQYNE